MKAIDYLISFPYLPASIEGRVGKVSNSEVRRWLKNKAVVINGKAPLPTDEITLPIVELIFFPNGGRRTTVVKY